LTNGLADLRKRGSATEAVLLVAVKGLRRNQGHEHLAQLVAAPDRNQSELALRKNAPK